MLASLSDEIGKFKRPLGLFRLRLQRSGTSATNCGLLSVRVATDTTQSGEPSGRGWKMSKCFVMASHLNSNAKSLHRLSVPSVTQIINILFISTGGQYLGWLYHSDFPNFSNRVGAKETLFRSCARRMKPKVSGGNCRFPRLVVLFIGIAILNFTLEVVDATLFA